MKLTFLIFSTSSLLRFCLCKSIDCPSFGFGFDSTKQSIITNSRKNVKSNFDWNEKKQAVSVPWCSFFWTTCDLSYVLWLKYWIAQWTRLYNIGDRFTFRCGFTIDIQSKVFPINGHEWWTCNWNKNTNKRQFFH